MNNVRYPADLIHISVTKADIDNGYTICGKLCPVALAVRRAVPESDYIFVGAEYIVVRIPSTDGSRYSERIYRLTDEIADFIDNFDHGHEVAPFEADLRAVA
jgi:hypothetical protein